jgi:hypothetical protein
MPTFARLLCVVGHKSNTALSDREKKTEQITLCNVSFVKMNSNSFINT